MKTLVNANLFGSAGLVKVLVVMPNGFIRIDSQKGDFLFVNLVHDFYVYIAHVDRCYDLL